MAAGLVGFVEGQANALGKIVRRLEIKATAAHGRAQRLVILVSLRAGRALPQVSFELQRAEQIQLAVQISVNQGVILRATHVRGSFSPNRSIAAEDARV